MRCEKLLLKAKQLNHSVLQALYSDILNLISLLAGVQVCVYVSCRRSAAVFYVVPFNGPLSGTTRVSWYQKGKTNLDFH